MDNNYIVYMHICPNNKKYIGITCNAKQRWGKNGYGYKSNILFSRAIKKYGWENIEHKILYMSLTEQEAKEKEIESIKKYGTLKPNGYNISIGGDNTTRGYKFTKIQKERLSKAKFEPVHCIESGKTYYTYKELKENKIAGCIKAVTGERATYKGEHYIRLKDLKKYKNGEIKLKEGLRKKVVCLETKKIYESIEEASKSTNTKASSISECCNNKLKSANKLHWQYYDENFDIGKCDELIKSKIKRNSKMCKKIMCVETGAIYENSAIAKRETKILHILECCKKERQTAGGFHWKYVNEVS